MAKKFDTWEGLLNQLKQDVVDLMNSMDKDFRSDNDNPKYVMMQKIDEVVYHKNAYNPTWYETTFQLRDSVEATKASVVGNNIEVGLYHNTDKMEYDPEYPRYSWSGSDISEYIPDIIEGEITWGSNARFPKDGAWNRKTHYQKNTADDLNNGRFKEWMIRQLVRKGYKII